MVYNFFTAYYRDDGELEINHLPIAIMYFKTFFFVDLLSNLPLSGGPWGLLKVFRLQRMSRVLTRWSYLGYDVTKIQSFKLAVFVLGVGHIIACLFFMASKYDFDVMAASAEKEYSGNNQEINFELENFPIQRTFGRRLPAQHDRTTHQH